jgi:hypothetical protein
LIDFSGLPAQAVDSWKRDEVTEHMFKQLLQAHQAWLGRLETSAANGTETEVVTAFGGRCVAIRDLIESIRGAKGRTTE